MSILASISIHLLEFCCKEGMNLKTKSPAHRYTTLLMDCSFLLLTVIFAWNLLFRSQIVTTSVVQSLHLCGDILIPSLFCFMVLTSFLSQSSFLYLMNLPLLPFSKLLSLPPSCGSVLLLSWIGGYPAGAKMLSDLWTEKGIKESTLKRLLLCSVCPAPSFVILSVGRQLLGNNTCGILLYISQVMGSLFLAVISSFFSAAINKKELCCFLRKRKSSAYSTALVNAVSFSSQTMLVMCAYTLFFSVISTLLQESLSLNSEAVAVVTGFLEITNGTVLLTKRNLPYLLTLLSFFLSFGGISVICQLKYILQDTPVTVLQLIIGRLCHGICSAAITTILVSFYPPAASVFSVDGSALPLSTAQSPLLTACLIGMLFIFTQSFHRLQAGKEK